MLLPVAEAQARVLALARPLPIEEAALLEAAGRPLASAVVARRDQPAADLSAMDGYAIRFAELPGPWTVVGESAAGGGLDQALAPGEAARVFTGAPVPDGADAILVQEEATREGNRLVLSGEGPLGVGSSIRRAGSDFRAGVTLVEAGAPLTPARIALAAIAGHGTLPVHRRPRVAIISTGDELVPPGQATPGVTLPASNAPMLAALLRDTPALAEDRGIVPDRLELLAAAFRAAATVADVIVTTGGASVGDHDLVRPALTEAGATLDFWRVAMKPGKPLMAGRLGGAIVLGLPGNPVSAFVTGHLFLLPLVRTLAGAAAPLPPRERAPLAAPLPPTGGRADFVRARLVGGALHPLPSRDSAVLSALGSADALIARPADAPAAAAGDEQDYLRIA